MTLQQLRGFLAIVEYGSFRRAARELGLSQAGLTNSLQALEASLSVRLMSRSAQGVNLDTFKLVLFYGHHHPVLREQQLRSENKLCLS